MEHNHELLLSIKNLRELCASPFRYIVLVISNSLLAELVKREHFVLINLLNSISSGSSEAGSTQARVAEGPLVDFVRLDQLSLA